jgi:hypothetical protein
MECVWEECPYQLRCRRLAQPCQHPRIEEQLTVLPPDRTDVQGSIQDTAATEANYVADNENRPRWPVQCKILQLWDDYANNKITASHLLKKCGSLYTPGV